MIRIGLYTYKSSRVRDYFQDFLTTLSHSIKHVPQEGPAQGKTLTEFLLEILVKNYPSEQYYYTTRECGEFFQLFGKLVDTYFA